jgi:hypothetical protein
MSGIQRDRAHRAGRACRENTISQDELRREFAVVPRSIGQTQGLQQDDQRQENCASWQRNAAEPIGSLSAVATR